MPLVRIDLSAGKSDDYRSTIGDVIYEAMVSALNVPKDDRFMVIGEHAPANLVADKAYLGIARSEDVVLIQVTLNEGRTVEMKKAFFMAVAKGLHLRLDMRMEDVFISLVEVPKQNWSFGNGEAQYA
jgi:4-oxalocrotonate tautomerase